MKIAHLIYSFNTGGSETMLVDIANEQVNYADVSIVIINKIFNSLLLKKLDKRVKVYFTLRTESSNNPYPIIKFNLLLLKLSADVLHCHNQNIIPLLLPVLKKKSVLTVHDVNINTKYFKQYKKVFAISQRVKEDILNRSGINAILVYNGICISAVMQKEDNTKQTIFKVIEISRLEHKKKGQDLAIEALYILKTKDIKNIQLDFIGTGSSEQYLIDLTVKYDLTDQVHFLGQKERDYIYTHLIEYDLLIQPSLYEGFGLTIIEGMAAKVPVLVSNVDGPMEIIENGKYGYYFESGIAENLAEQLQYILSNNISEKYQLKIGTAYNHVKTNFDVKLTAQNYINNYFLNS